MALQFKLYRKWHYNLQLHRKWHYNLQLYRKWHYILKVQKALLKSMSCVTECTTLKILQIIKALIWSQYEYTRSVSGYPTHVILFDSQRHFDQTFNWSSEQTAIQLKVHYHNKLHNTYVFLYFSYVRLAGACGTHGGEISAGFQWRNLRGRDHF